MKAGRVISMPEATRLLNEELPPGARPWDKRRVLQTLQALQAQLNENLLFRFETATRKRFWKITYENFRRCFPEKSTVASTAYAEGAIRKCVRDHGARLDGHEDDLCELRKLFEEAVARLRDLSERVLKIENGRR